MKKLSILTLCTALCGSAANAAVIVNLTEDPGGWTAAFAGTIDVSGLGHEFGSIQRQSLWYAQETYVRLGVGGDATNFAFRYEIVSGPGLPTEPGVQHWLWENGGFETTGEGPIWELYVNEFGTSSVGLNVRDFFDGMFDGHFEGYTRWRGPGGGTHPYTIAETVLQEGRYVYGLANGETVTLNIGNAFAQPLPTGPDTPQVPVPAGLPLLAAGLAALAGLARRRR